MSPRIHYSGLIIALLGFFLTRFTVTLALYESPLQFYFSGIIPLVLGLGLAAFGVALTIADVDAQLVRTTALWCVIGFLTMLLLTLLTLLGTTPDGTITLTTVRSQTALSNFLIGGSVGGTLTGLYAARNQHQRTELKHHANRLEVLNRLLRHNVLNAITIIKGYATLDTPTAPDIIQTKAADIETTINDLKHLTPTPDASTLHQPTNLTDILQESTTAIHERHPDTTITIDAPSDNALHVQADQQLALVFTHLLENAVTHGNDSTPTVAITPTHHTVEISITDTGPGLPARQQALIETGEIEPFDDPTTGFGLNIVRLLVNDYNGTIDTDVSAAGTTITVGLPRADSTASSGSEVRLASGDLLITLAASVFAGIAYGLVSEALGGTVAGIGVFYGIADPIVGWLTHEFHSIVFGFIYLGLVSVAPDRWQTSWRGHLGIGLAWGFALWVGAAGVIAPFWLQLLGIPASLPSFSPPLLVTHLVWGLTLGGLCKWGYSTLSPRIEAWLDAHLN